MDRYAFFSGFPCSDYSFGHSLCKLCSQDRYCFSELMISYNIPTAAGDSAVLLKAEEQGAFLYLLVCCLIPPSVSAAERVHGNNTAL